MQGFFWGGDSTHNMLHSGVSGMHACDNYIFVFNQILYIYNLQFLHFPFNITVMYFLLYLLIKSQNEMAVISLKSRQSACHLKINMFTEWVTEKYLPSILQCHRSPTFGWGSRISHRQMQPGVLELFVEAKSAEAVWTVWLEQILLVKHIVINIISEKWNVWTYQQINWVIVYVVQYFVYKCKKERIGESSYSCLPFPRQIPISHTVKAVSA